MFTKLKLMCLGVGLMLAGGCIKAPPFVCTKDEQCNSKPPGICIQYTGLKGACAVPVGDCPSGYRYHESAGQGQAEQCVTIPRFEITSVASADEHQTISAHVIVYDNNGQKLASYTGAPVPTTNWGDITVLTAPVFAGGEANMVVSLNRATPPETGGAKVSLEDGVIKGASAITINEPKWMPSQTQRLSADDNSAQAFHLANVAILQQGSNYSYYVIAQFPEETGPVVYGKSVFTLGGSSPLFDKIAPNVKVGSSSGQVGFNSVQRFSKLSNSTPLLMSFDKPGYKWGLASSNDGITWDIIADSPEIDSSQFCGDYVPPAIGPSFPPDPTHAILAEDSNHLRMVYMGASRYSPVSPGVFSPCTAESSDGGHTWNNPTPLVSNNWKPKTLWKEGTIFKGWGDGKYGSSTDAVTWTVLPSQNLSSVFWNEVGKEYFGVKLDQKGHVLEIYRRP